MDLTRPADVSQVDGIALRRFEFGGGTRLWNSAAAKRETEFIHNEIFRDHCYEQHGVEVRDGDVIVDAGANIGAFVVSLLGRHQTLDVIAIEPSPVSRACLERNVADAPGRDRSRVRIVPVALGAERGELNLTYFPNAPGNSTFKPEDKRGEVDRLIRGATPAQARTLHRLLGFMPKSWVEIALRLHFRPLFERQVETTCPVRPLSDLLADEKIGRIDLLKIDVEGFELEVLAGLRDADWPKVRQLVMEVSPANKPGLPDLLARLKALGFHQIAVDSPGGTEPTPDNPLACLVFAIRKADERHLRLRAAREADAEALSTFSVLTYARAFGEHFRPGDLEAHLQANLSVDRWRHYLERDRVLIAEDDSGLAGYLQIEPRHPAGVFFHRLYVAPDRLGQGIGSALLKAGLDEPVVKAATQVLIDVWEENSGAIRLYERFGFVLNGERGEPFVTASGESSPGDLIMVRRQN